MDATIELLRQHLLGASAWITRSDVDELLPHFQLRSYGRGESLGRQGEATRLLTFVTEGLVRTYHISATGEEHTLAFADAGRWASDLDSYLHQNPSALTLEAVTETSALVLPYARYRELQTRPEFGRLMLYLLQSSLGYMQRRLIDHHLSRTAEDLYWDFIEECPGLQQQITNKQIASYLGVSGECVSRIRRRDKH